MDRYEYPPVDRIDPFDVRRGQPQFIVFGGGRSSYATTERPDLLGLKLADWIPMGYKVLSFAQKAAVFRRGKPAREWPLVVDGPDEEPPLDDRPGLRQTHAWKRSSCGYRLQVPGRDLHVLGYDRTEADEAAAAASRPRGPAALWFVYDVANWH
ncbi:hypothetical protein [Glycomyces paridis]|uniref:Uncharacterized protein n=1 Tax=Glycomyces paridis TaxID=2126555 RepID=A0A4V4HNZ9_9ACTN|nr:hypothetical protein [Glycomyces paridis]THV28056.1 hypothetical protein E9998_13845 [Glycomyces paridis]